MERISTTPFGRRPVSAGLLATDALARAPAPVPEADKWALFHDLRTARVAFGVTDRDLTVLNALLSFLPERGLRDGEGLVVFPSNASLSDRAHGMAESTLRRHLAALVQAGLILRHDSPNGKRYASRGAGGDVIRAFGFDLRPLLVRSAEIARAAQAAREAAARLRLARETAVLRLRDARKLADYARAEGLPGDWDAVEADLAAAARTLRRRLAAAEAEGLAAELARLAARIAASVQPPQQDETEETDGNAARIGRHLSNSNPERHESEPCPEKGRGAGACGQSTAAPSDRDIPAIPLALVLKACPDILPYADGRIRHWHELVATAGRVRGMMGISGDAWNEAQRVMGHEVASVAVAGILQRIGNIQRPGGYLRALSARASAGQFSPGPMIMALLNTAGDRAIRG